MSYGKLFSRRMRLNKADPGAVLTLVGVGGCVQGHSQCCCIPLGQHFSLRLSRARGLLLGFGPGYKHQLFKTSHGPLRISFIG